MDICESCIKIYIIVELINNDLKIKRDKNLNVF